ncbi:MAG: 3'-5' exoribonuclease [Rhodoferax sp.]|nr:3'-5' exoribonuclease [Rhodoferax sp.]MCF8210952.1 3'-5' exoribonuclease [Rhodoferax sp.]
MHVFFDTEFTGLTSDPCLLSIGLMVDNGDTLYLEFTDGWQESACSTWVRQHILPTLWQGERLTRRAAGQRIFDWLLSLDAPLILLADSDYDTALLTELLQQCGLTHDSFRIQQLAFTGKPQALEFEVAKRRYLASQNLAPHHALSDAAALCAAWQQTMGQA